MNNLALQQKYVRSRTSPCPVCGANVQVLRPMGQSWTIYCNSCGRNDAEVTADTVTEAIGKWNRLGRQPHD